MCECARTKYIQEGYIPTQEPDSVWKKFLSFANPDSASKASKAANRTATTGLAHQVQNQPFGARGVPIATHLFCLVEFVHLCTSHLLMRYMPHLITRVDGSPSRHRAPPCLVHWTLVLGPALGRARRFRLSRFGIRFNAYRSLRGWARQCKDVMVLDPIAVAIDRLASLIMRCGLSPPPMCDV